MVNKVKNLLIAIYCTIAIDGLLISGAILLNIINTVYVKVYMIKMMKDGIITLEKANTVIVGEILLGFVITTFICWMIKVGESEAINKDERNSRNDS